MVEQVKEGAATPMAAPIPIDILFPVHGRPELTIKAIKAIYACTQVPFHLIILDDTDASILYGSFHRVEPTDLTSPYLIVLTQRPPEGRYLNPNRRNGDNPYITYQPEITYINHPKPFKEGNAFFNLGLSYCKYDYFATIMNSLTVQPGWETHALELFQRDSELGIIGLKNLLPDGTIESAGIIFDNFQPNDFCRGAPGHLFTQDIEVPAAQWAFALIRKKAAVGNIEEGLFHGFVGWDDIDNCFAIKAKGWKILYCGHGAGIHEPRATRGTNDPQAGKMNQENAYTFYKRWGLWKNFQEANKLDVKFKLRQETKDRLTKIAVEYQVLQQLTEERNKTLSGMVREALEELGVDPKQYHLAMNPSLNLWDMRLNTEPDGTPLQPPGKNGEKEAIPQAVGDKEELPVAPINRAARRRNKKRVKVHGN